MSILKYRLFLLVSFDNAKIFSFQRVWLYSRNLYLMRFVYFVTQSMKVIFNSACVYCRKENEFRKNKVDFF